MKNGKLFIMSNSMVAMRRLSSVLLYTHVKKCGGWDLRTNLPVKIGSKKIMLRACGKCPEAMLKMFN
jgi:hypothetical protein